MGVPVRKLRENLGSQEPQLSLKGFSRSAHRCHQARFVETGQQIAFRYLIAARLQAAQPESRRAWQVAQVLLKFSEFALETT